LFEIKSPDILQPGPAALTDGVAQIHAIVTRWMDADLDLTKARGPVEHLTGTDLKGDFN